MSAHTPRMFKHGHTFQNVEQEHDLNTHIDQLTEWWENATPIFENVDPGTVIIGYMADGSYEIFTESDQNAPQDYVGGHTEYRILARAPKPKPAWHDARAVIAHVNDLRGAHRRVFVRRTKVSGGILWEDEISSWPPAELIDPVPLIEAKVTDAMIENAWSARDHNGQPYFTEWREASDFLTAALGLETE